MSEENIDLPDSAVSPDNIQEEAGDLWFAHQHLQGDDDDSVGRLRAFLDYLPGGDEMAEKTNVEMHQTRALAQLMMIPRLDPEFDGDDVEKVDNMIDLYLKLRVSMDGKSREEFMRILQALASGQAHGSPGEEGGSPSIVMRGFGAGGDDDE